ncbi:hypothetical protein K431DRAFT_315733 [Polychaeton citri CBS 116435]|uniref:DUF1690-domain-containing protein n=1 Tax=Polychaeton citri CBS 116435 TaxID=1314669 RepID=A0A9P4Q325_9PEZI|nr:hypothetical protein K431DRAFT_315733 [Polychaeton citri CBS 116435]
MGSGGSKPEQQNFSPDTPIQFSQTLLKSLQDNPETDSTRALTTEFNLEARRNEALTRERDAAVASLTQSLDHYTTNPPTTPSEPPSDAEAFPPPNTGIFYHLSSPFYQDHSTPATKEAEIAAGNKKRINPDISHSSIMEEVKKLKQKLDARKKLEKPSVEVEKAREGLVQCLRVNDRRPLDCWQEKEAFEVAVKSLESRFLTSAGR